MNPVPWAEQFPGGVTVCDTEGIIVYMNEKSAKIFEKDGGMALIGSNLYDCHPEPAAALLRELMANQRTNAYTIEKRGIKKMIYQAPWYRDGVFAGMVELSLEIPMDMPHFIRQGA